MRPWSTLLAVGLALSLSHPARAAGYQIEPSLAEDLDIAQDGRRLPGQPPPVEETPAPETGPPAVAPPTRDYPREFIPVPDRWRLIEESGLTSTGGILTARTPSRATGRSSATIGSSARPSSAIRCSSRARCRRRSACSRPRTRARSTPSAASAKPSSTRICFRASPSPRATPPSSRPSSSSG